MSTLRSRPSGRLRPRHRTCAIALLLVACGGIGALAAPLPPPRAGRELPSPRKGLARDLSPDAATALERACGTDIDALPQLYQAAAEHAAASGLTPQPTPNSTDVGEIAVLEDDGTFFFTDKGGNVNLDVAAASRAFYRTHGDDYDDLVMWLATGLSNWLGSPTALAARWSVRNDMGGIGLDPYVFNPSLGVPPRVLGVLTMNGLQRYPDDPSLEVPGLPFYVTQDVVAHEFGHEWLAYVQVQTPLGPSTRLLGRAFQHWSFFFDSNGSVMEGCNWVAAGPDTFWQLPPTTNYGPLDQYLMGVRSPGEVDSLTVLADTCKFTPPGPNGPYVPFSEGNGAISAKGPSTRYGIEDVVAANGPRTPDASTAPHSRHLAFILIVPRGTAATSQDLAKVEGIRQAFPGTVDQYTGGRMSVDVSLISHAGRLRLEHTPLGDTETPGVSRPVSLRVTVDQAGIPIAVDPSGVTLLWHTLPQTSWNALSMSAASGDSFVAAIPGAASGATTEYRFIAQSDSAGLFEQLPHLLMDPPFAYRTGPDVTPPQVTHWVQATQALERLPQPLLARVRDNLGPSGIDSVWCEYSLDRGPLQSLPVVRTGADSFVVSLGAGAVRGSAIAYRFAARDRAAAANVGYSNPGFDTLRVDHDAVDGFWNPSPWTHDIYHYNRRDEWHPVETAAFPSGSGAWHCGLEGIPYGPYQDAALMSPSVANITAGTYVTFVHHYDLEAGSGEQGFDGAIVEVQVGSGAWQLATPDSGYSHIMAESDQGIAQDTPCWSGRRDDWHEERVDLSPYAPGPIHFRFRMSTDLFVGRGGWWVDDVHFHFPSQSTTDAGPPADAALALGATWPNPVAGTLHQALRLPRTARVDWALFDVAGRRAATLHAGTLVAGAHELAGALPRGLSDGLYFSRVSVDGRALAAHRVAVVR